MIDNVLKIVGMKIRQSRNGHRAIGHGCEIRHRPIDRVLTYQCDLIARLDIAVLKDVMQPDDLFRHIAETNRVAFIICERRQIPIFLMVCSMYSTRFSFIMDVILYLVIEYSLHKPLFSVMHRIAEFSHKHYFIFTEGSRGDGTDIFQKLLLIARRCQAHMNVRIG